MISSIRYYRPGFANDTGLLIVKQSEFAAYKARLETQGYVVVDDRAGFPLDSVEKSR